MASKSLLDYLQAHYEAAQEVTSGTPVNPIIVLAMGAFESRFGNSDLSRLYNNHFGIKGTGNDGSITLSTLEYRNGAYHRVPQSFARYTDYKASAQAFVRLLLSQRYSRALQYTDPINQLRGIIASGYATDPNYIGKIKPIVEAAEQMQMVSNNLINPLTLLVISTGIYLFVTNGKRKSVQALR